MSNNLSIMLYNELEKLCFDINLFQNRDKKELHVGSFIHTLNHT